MLTAIDAPTTDPPPQYDAQIENFQFTPNPINASPGGKLIWTNKQNVAHTVVSDTGDFKSQVLAEGRIIGCPGRSRNLCVSLFDPPLYEGDGRREIASGRTRSRTMPNLSEP